MASEMAPILQEPKKVSKISRKKIVILAAVTAVALIAGGLYCYFRAAYQYVELKNLIANPTEYKNKKIVVDATHCVGFEISSIGIKGYETIFLNSQMAQIRHLVFNGKLLTDSPSGCKGARIYGTFHHTDATIPTEDVIKVVVDGFGHMNSYASELEADVIIYKDFISSPSPSSSGF